MIRTRISLWAEEEIRLNHLPPKSGAILEAVLYRGELPRADAAGISGTGDRQARRVVSALISSSLFARTQFPGDSAGCEFIGCWWPGYTVIRCSSCSARC